MNIGTHVQSLWWRWGYHVAFFGGIFSCLGLLSLQVSCGGAACADTCKPGERRCDATKGLLLICAKGLQTNCYTWGSIPCNGGTCLESHGQAVCEGDTQSCKDACQVGEKRCQGDIPQTCIKAKDGGCPLWADGMPCEAGKYCVKGTCSSQPPTCQDACKAQEARCAGNATQTCVKGASGCLEWSKEVACAAGEICQNGKCEDNCKHLCTVGQKRCTGVSIQACVLDSISQCPLWGKPQACPNGQTCDAGICKPSSNCQVCTEGQKRCQGNNAQVCVKDAKGCTLWGAPKACPHGQTCDAGVCKPGSGCQTCTAGQTRCQGNATQACVQDAKGCTSWSTPKACPSGQTCDAGACKVGCPAPCTEGQKRCQGNGVQTCAKDTKGCLVWGTAVACPSGQTCSAGVCKAGCPAPCTAGSKRCQGNSVQTCAKDAKGCLVWGNASACPSGQVCSGGLCANPGDPSTRSQKTVCDRWKADYPSTTPANFTNNGGCDPGKISQGSIDDAIRRITLYRWLLGLPATVEDKALTTKTQACAILQANNDGPGAGINPHRPPSNWKCYNTIGAQTSGQSNLSWGVGHPADTITQYISDAQVSSLGHRLWIISPGFGKTGIGLATGSGRYRVASCLYTFARTAAPKVDFIAYPPPGFVPIQAMGSGTRHRVLDWSFTSSKYNVSSLTEVTLTRKSDGDVQKLKPRRIGNYGHPSGLAFRPRFPAAGESYTVEFGTIFSYEVKFFDCK